MTTPKKFDAAPILQRLAEIRRSIPFLEAKTPRAAGDGRLTASGGFEPRTAEEFEYAALADGLESLADDLAAAIERKHAEATEQALRIYYTAEELSRDPAHAHLIPHVQRMREAYEQQYGRPIPPKKE